MNFVFARPVLEEGEHSEAAAAHFFYFGEIQRNDVGQGCACTASRSLKTSSLRMILPLHSITVRSPRFSTLMASMESPSKK